MKIGFKKAARVFKYLAIVFAVVYWIFVVADDWVLISKHWADNWLMYLAIWAAWFTFYLLAFAVYYWIIATVVILIYYKLLLKQKIDRN